jgi:hypothetical protein
MSVGDPLIIMQTNVGGPACPNHDSHQIRGDSLHEGMGDQEEM